MKNANIAKTTATKQDQSLCSASFLGTYLANNITVDIRKTRTEGGT
jgi:hypothetical protein